MHDLSATIALLTRTPASLDALLRGLPEVWIQGDEGDGTWNAFDVVGHLIDGEYTDWIPRARMILEAGDSKTFAPFDRGGHAHITAGKSLSDLLDEFGRARAGTLDALRAMNLSGADLARRGRHPAFGVVTMSQLLATWAAHDLTHLHQISRVMAYQYRDSVGPWIEFLGVMKCQGHSA